MWPLRSPHWPASKGTLVTNHFIDDKGFIWAGDAFTNRILKFDLDGNFLYSWGAPGPQPGRFGCSHGITTDQLGNLYLADCFAGRVQKFEPIPARTPTRSRARSADLGHLEAELSAAAAQRSRSRRDRSLRETAQDSRSLARRR